MLSFTQFVQSYHKASQRAHHHTIIVGLGLMLFASTLTWNMSHTFFGEQSTRAAGPGVLYSSLMTLTGSSTSSFIASGDVNEDNNTDLVLFGQSSYIRVMTGNGDGTFNSPYVPPSDPWSGDHMSSVVGFVADFNNDNNVDIIAGRRGNEGESLILLTGNGDGTFNVGRYIYSSGYATNLKVADINEDGELDLIIGTYQQSNQFLAGNGDGTFQNPINLGDGVFETRGIDVADINNDNNLDISVINRDSDPYFIAGNGDGTFQSPITFDLDPYVHSGLDITSADLNNDGNLDIIMSFYNSQTDNAIIFFAGNGDGTFDTFQDWYSMYDIRACEHLTFTYLNSDDYLDFLCGKSYEGGAYSKFGFATTGGVFSGSYAGDFHTSNHDTQYILLADIDNNNYDDIIFANYSIANNFILTYPVQGRCAEYAGSIDIPLSECEVLEDIYESTAQNFSNSNWFKGTTICNDGMGSGGWTTIFCTDGNITSIESPSGTAWAGAIPDSIDNLTELEKLYLPNGAMGPLYGSYITSLPESIGNLANLKYLTVGATTAMTSLPTSIGNLGDTLITFDLQGSSVSSLPPSFSNLTNLESLTLSYNNLYGTIPNYFTSFTNLDYFYLDNNCLDIQNSSIETINFIEGIFSYAIHSQDNCGEFDIALDYNATWCTENAANIGVPVEECEALVVIYNAYTDSGNNAGNITNNWFATASICGWYGVTCTDNSVSSLDIGGYSAYVGSVPTAFFDLPNLTGLIYSNNNIPETGSILYQLSGLQSLYMNAMQGDIGLFAHISTLSGLHVLSLNQNSLSEIPGFVFDLPILEELYINNNSIPSLSGDNSLSTLRILDLSANQITQFPVAIENMSGLQELYLANNQLGEVPRLTGLTSLQTLDLYNNGITGFLPYLHLMPSLTTLNLSNNCWDTYNSNMLAAKIVFDNNVLVWYGNENHPGGSNCGDGSPLLTYTDDWCYENIDAMGVPLIECLALKDLNETVSWAGNVVQNSRWYVNNGPYIEIPISSWSGVTVSGSNIISLTAGGTILSGYIPDSITGIAYLEILSGSNINHNILGFPDNFGALDYLRVISLYGNGITELPDSFANLDTLETLILSSNTLNGFPEEIYALDNLQYLDLSSNTLSTISSALGDVTTLRYLNLNSTSISSLPDEIGNLTGLQTGYFSNNTLSSLPDEFGNLTSLETLYMDNNQLQVLPTGFANFTNLYTLSLYNNRIYGGLPSIAGIFKRWDSSISSTETGLNLYSNCFAEIYTDPAITAQVLANGGISAGLLSSFYSASQYACIVGSGEWFTPPTLTHTVSPSSFASGNTVLYTFSYTNKVGLALSGVTLKSYFPTGFTLTEASGIYDGPFVDSTGTYYTVQAPDASTTGSVGTVRLTGTVGGIYSHNQAVVHNASITVQNLGDYLVNQTYSKAVTGTYKSFICGNSIYEIGEQCEDGNTTNGDGCNSSCQLENTVECLGTYDVYLQPTIALSGYTYNYAYSGSTGILLDFVASGYSTSGIVSYSWNSHVSGGTSASGYLINTIDNTSSFFVPNFTGLPTTARIFMFGVTVTDTANRTGYISTYVRCTAHASTTPCTIFIANTTVESTSLTGQVRMQQSGYIHSISSTGISSGPLQTLLGATFFNNTTHMWNYTGDATIDTQSTSASGSGRLYTFALDYPRYNYGYRNTSAPMALISPLIYPYFYQTTTLSCNPYPATCGNNIVESGEQCEDYNIDNGDGCSSTCQYETPECTITLSTTGATVPGLVEFEYTIGDISQFAYFDYGDGTTGADNFHTYTNTGIYTPRLYVSNILDNNIQESCSDGTVRIRPDFGFVANNSGSNHVNVRWNHIGPTGQVLQYIVKYRPVGSPTWETTTVSGSSEEITDLIESLEAGEDYDFQVCSDEEMCSDPITVSIPEENSSNGNDNTGGGGGGGGGGGSSYPSIQMDECIPLPPGDISPSYYDDDCGPGEIRKEIYEQFLMEKGYPDDHLAPDTTSSIADDLIPDEDSIADVLESTDPSIYTQELVTAYIFAKNAGMTTMETIDDAMLYESMTREQFAKIASAYALHVLDIKPDMSRSTVCSAYSDIADRGDLTYWMQVSCMLNIMGQKSDGKTPDNTFRPEEIVTRSQYLTVLSRMLFGDAYNSKNIDDDLWYAGHMQAMRDRGYVQDISNPFAPELRGYAFLILYRTVTK